MVTDLTFITNEPGTNLKERFNVLIKDSRFFDILVGYFYSSGFYAIYPALETTENIRILVGINMDKKVSEWTLEGKKEQQLEMVFSHAETKKLIENEIVSEFVEASDDLNVEQGVQKFIEWIRTKKLEIKAFPSKNIHAKLYIMTFREGDRDTGRVITGSSNLTQAGLVENLEFNVELKNPNDFNFAKEKFDALWADAVDVSDKYVETITKKTWLNQDIIPYHLYLKFLYEYFKDELSHTEDVFANYFPEDFMKLEYQEQAVLNAKKILEEYGGVFIADVVGLGKTYIATLLAGQLSGRTLVIAPPVLLDKDNPGSWTNAFSDFRIAADFESVGKLDSVIEKGTEKYTNIIIDEAHRFRTETNMTYERLAEICRGKRVILVTATPYNNSPKDILSEIKLFQNSKRSTIPNMRDLDSFFGRLARKLKGLDRLTDNKEYLRIVKENSNEIREKVLKYLMVRRTRTEIVKYFSQDLNKQKLRFPEVAAPGPLYYELNDAEDNIFTQTIQLVSQEFKYARYTPLLYLKKDLGQLEEQSQRNMGKFMKILLVKRLESSFFAFQNSIGRFIHSYEMFIREYEKGNVYTSKKHSAKIFEYLEADDDKAIQRLLDEGKADKYSSSEFEPKYLALLENDLSILKLIQTLWSEIERDPKLLSLLNELSNNIFLKDSKIVLFTESKETAEYLVDHVNKVHNNQAVCFTGGSGEAVRETVINNFDAKARHQENKYRILISTEVLSEGVNLHRANVVINYDIPWNPTRMMQRVGRINRVDTKFDTIYTFNFFPTRQSNDELKLKEAAEAKINAFLTLLGGDAALLTDGEPIGSHELFDRLGSKKTITGEDEEENSELKYLTLIKNIRDNNADLFEKIKYLPKKARSGKRNPALADSLITYFRKGKVQKFFIAGSESETREFDFITAAETMESLPEEKRHKLSNTFFELLDKNKTAFMDATTEDSKEIQVHKGQDSAIKIKKILKAVFKDTKQLTDDQEAYLKRVIEQLEAGGFPKQTTKIVLKALEDLKSGMVNPLKVLAALQFNIPSKLLESHYVEDNPRDTGKREVILSMYLAGEDNE